MSDAFEITEALFKPADGFTIDAGAYDERDGLLIVPFLSVVGPATALTAGGDVVIGTLDEAHRPGHMPGYTNYLAAAHITDGNGDTFTEAHAVIRSSGEIAVVPHTDSPQERRWFNVIGLSWSVG